MPRQDDGVIKIGKTGRTGKTGNWFLSVCHFEDQSVFDMLIDQQISKANPRQVRTIEPDPDGDPDGGLDDSRPR